MTSQLFYYTPKPTEDQPDSVPKPTVYNRILHKAAELVGGQRALARYLKVPLPDLYTWIRPGAEPPPTVVFLKAVDLVLNDLEMSEEQRAQKLRVAAIHEDLQRASVMQRLHELLPK